jgi:hypothetical protein
MSTPEFAVVVPPPNRPNSRRLQVAGPPGMSAEVNAAVISRRLVKAPPRNVICPADRTLRAVSV